MHDRSEKLKLKVTKPFQIIVQECLNDKCYVLEKEHFLTHLFHNFTFVFRILLLQSKEIKHLDCVTNKQITLLDFMTQLKILICT